MSEKIEVGNVNVPSQVTRVDRAKYEAMRAAILDVLPTEGPGLTHAEYKAALLPSLPANLFPEGKAAGWWSKTVQLDLEARGIIARSETKPLRFYKT